MHLVYRCSLPVWRRSFLKKGTPRDLFWPRPGSAPGGIWPKNNNTCKGPWVLHPYQVSSKSIQGFWRRSRKCESLRTDGRTDGRTDDGRCAMTIAHSSLRLRWAKNGVTRSGVIWVCGGARVDEKPLYCRFVCTGGAANTLTTGAGPGCAHLQYDHE